MREAFLHYIWQYQYFEKEGLSTINGEVLTIQNSGFLNLDAGPDFLQGKVLLDHIQWQGSIEIHVRSLDWKLHAHSKDKAYDNVILHVVWEDNGPVYRSDNTLIPTLELKKRVDLQLIEKYEKLVHAPNTQIPCERMFAKTPDIIKLDMLDRMASERLVAKARNIDEIRKRNNGDWEETVYQTLARSYGLKINAQTFERLSNLMPFRIIRKHSHSLFELEALLFGVAGFLDDDPIDDYHRELKNQFNFLKQKYELHNRLNKSFWKFLRLRPANFPTLRLSQFAALLHENSSLFDQFLNITDHSKAEDWIKTKPSAYWRRNYTFGKASKIKIGGLGKATSDIIIINVVVPLLISYGKSIDSQKYIDRGFRLLEEIKPEKNKIVRLFQDLELSVTSALDTQALIQLHSEYCNKKECLRCSIGNYLVKPK